MKKIVIVLIVVLMITGCGTTKTEQVYSAEEVVNKLKESGLPIDNMIVYTEQTDLNNLLGKPNSYTSKVNFADTRVEQLNEESPAGGSVEVFSTEADMLARKNYIETVSKGIGPIQQFYFTKGCILLRIDYDLTTEQANEYKDVLNSIE